MLFRTILKESLAIVFALEALLPKNITTDFFLVTQMSTKTEEKCAKPKMKTQIFKRFQLDHYLLS